jgi:hypothetical protein
LRCVPPHPCCTILREGCHPCIPYAKGMEPYQGIEP